MAHIFENVLIMNTICAIAIGLSTFSFLACTFLCAICFPKMLTWLIDRRANLLMNEYQMDAKKSILENPDYVFSEDDLENRQNIDLKEKPKGFNWGNKYGVDN